MFQLFKLQARNIAVAMALFQQLFFILLECDFKANFPKVYLFYREALKLGAGYGRLVHGDKGSLLQNRGERALLESRMKWKRV